MLDSPPTGLMVSTLMATELEDLLTYLSQVHCVDLRGYKRSTLLRRTEVRMQRLKVRNYQDYFNYLEQQPDEVPQLLNTIYINFTDFFRDRFVWDYLANEIIPQIIANKAPHEPIRIWSAACASGEETYSLAILFAEALGSEQFQQRVQIYGTDVDPEAIQQARQGYYPAYAIEAIPPALQAQYFEHREDLYCWRQDLHCSINFQLHNLIQDPPLPQVDLLVCRNLLIYLTPETQLRVLARLHQSLEQTGFLLLGQAENLVTPPETSLFTPLHLRARAFTKTPGTTKAYRARRSPKVKVSAQLAANSVLLDSVSI